MVDEFGVVDNSVQQLQGSLVHPHMGSSSLQEMELDVSEGY